MGTDIVDKIKAPEGEKPNDDSILFFGDGDPNIPSDMLTELVGQYLDKVDDDDTLPSYIPPDVVDKVEAPGGKKQNDDSVLFFGDGDPNIPSDMVIDLVTKHLDKAEEEKGEADDDKIDPSFTVVEKADAPNNGI